MNHRFGGYEVVCVRKELGYYPPAQITLRIFSHETLGEMQGWELTVQQLNGGRTRKAENEFDRFRCLESAEE